MTPYAVVLLAAVIAFLAWLVQRALHRADEQRRVASRLQAYLMYWTRCAINMKGGAELLTIGQEWYEEERKVYRAGGRRDEMAKKLVEVENKYQSGLAEQFKSELSGKAPASDAIQDARALFAKHKEARGEVTSHLFQLRKELIEGHTFVRDNDLAILDVSTVQSAVELRLVLAGLLGDLVWLLQSVEVLEGQQLEESLQKLIISTVKNGLRVSYLMKKLMGRCDYYLKRARLNAVKENLGA